MKEKHQESLKKEREEFENKFAESEEKHQLTFKKKLKKMLKKEKDQAHVKLQQEKANIKEENERKIKDLFEKISAEYEENLVNFKEEAERKSRHCLQLEKEINNLKSMNIELHKVINLHEEQKIREKQLPLVNFKTRLSESSISLIDKGTDTEDLNASNENRICGKKESSTELAFKIQISDRKDLKNQDTASKNSEKSKDDDFFSEVLASIEKRLKLIIGIYKSKLIRQSAERAELERKINLLEKQLQECL